MALQSPCRQPPIPLKLAIGTLYIWDVQGFELAQSIRAVERRDFDLMLLTKTNISMTAYCWNRLGYDVTSSLAQPSSTRGSQGRIGLVTGERPSGLGIDSIFYHGPKVVSCDIITGLTGNPLVGTYIPPSIMEHLPDLEEVLKCFRDPIVLRHLNVDLNEARRPRRP